MVIAFPRRTETGEFVERTLSHEGNALPKFYAALEGPVPVGSRSASEGLGHTARMHVTEESHCGIVPLNHSNKDGRFVGGE